MRIVWSDDWEVGNHFEEYGETYSEGEPEVCEQCIVFSESGEVLASLGCIDDASDDYRRQIESELMDEARRDSASL